MRLYKETETRLTERSFLKKLGISKKRFLAILEEDDMKEAFAKVGDPLSLSYEQVIRLWDKTAARFGAQPGDGWLAYLCETTVSKLFGDEDRPEEPDCAGSAALLWEVLDAFSDFRRKEAPFDPTRNIQPATEEEIAGCDAREEYLRMMKLCRSMHIFTFLMLEKEYIGFDTVFCECVQSDCITRSDINDCSAVIGESVFFCIAGQVIGLAVFDSENFSVTGNLIINALIVSARKVAVSIAERNLNLNYIICSDCAENDFFSLFG
jgi:hypothetical protein